MSAPNKNYDPVEVTALSAEAVEQATTAALAAISSAQTLDELKEARIAHAGDKAPLSLARAEIGALPPQARADDNYIYPADGSSSEARYPAPRGSRTYDAGGYGPGPQQDYYYQPRPYYQPPGLFTYQR